jgi:hypothetical protein
MLCSEFLLVKSGDGYTDYKPLPCDRWSCPYCAPRRRRALIAQAAAGQPNKILTLTIDPTIGQSSTHRRALLHEAWKNLGKRLLRQFKLPPEKRWSLRHLDYDAHRLPIIRAATKETPPGECLKLHYMAFIEKTKRGEPHLHILLRCPFVPQEWIADQMLDMVGSPIVWIEQIHSTAKAIAYVTKYVGKAPAQFGTAKRYWVSREWLVSTPDEPETPVFDMRGAQVVRERWAELIQQKTCARFWRQDIEDGWVRFWKPGTYGPEGGMVPNAARKGNSQSEG